MEGYMAFREWNNRKNNWLRVQKGKWAARLLGRASEAEPYRPQAVSSVLLLRNDNKLGDMVTCSTLLRALGALFPHARLDIIAGKDNASLLAYHPGVHRVYRGDQSFSSLWRLGRQLRREKYDLYIDVDEKPTLSSLVFLKLLAPRWACGFNRENYPLYNLDEKLDLSSFHVTRRYEAAVRKLGFTGIFDPEYKVFLPLDSAERARRFAAGLPRAGRLFVFSPQAASRHRSFSVRQMKETALLLKDDKIVLAGKTEKLREWMGILPRNVYLFESAQGVLDLAALVRMADGLLTVDTFWVHLACAVKTPTVAVYQHWRDNLTVWSPNADNVTVIFCEEEQSDVPAQRLADALERRVQKISA